MTTQAETLGPINAELCRSHWNILYEAWDTLLELKECDALFILTGQPKTEDDLFKRIGSFHLWSFMLIFPDTLLVLFKDRRVLFSGRQRKLRYFVDLEQSEVGRDFKFEFYQREPKQVETFAEQFRVTGLLESFEKCKAGDNSELPPRIGAFLNESMLPRGAVVEAVMSVLGFPYNGVTDLDNEGFNTGEFGKSAALKLRWRAVDNDLSRLPLRLDASGVEPSRLASVASGRLVKEVLVNRVVNILDQEIKENHRAICDKAESALEDPSRVAKWKTKLGIECGSLEVHYSLVESGQTFSLDPDETPNEKDLHLGRGSIVIGVALKYLHNAVGHVARTVLMDVGTEEKQLYTAALDVQDHIIRQLKPGARFNEVFNVGWTYAQEKHPNLAKHLTQDFGGAIGTPNLFVPNFKLDASSDQAMDANMAVSVVVAAPNIPLEQPISIWLADTVLVTPEAPTDLNVPNPFVWTSCCPKKLDDVLYALEGDKPSEKENRADKVQKSGSKATTSSATSRRSTSQQRSAAGPATRVRSRRANAGITQAEQEKLLAKQRELRRRKLQELRERFREGGMGFAKDKKDIRKLSHLTAYRDSSEFPRDLRANKCCIDTVRETLLIPMGQRHVPFHVSTLRNVSHQDEDRTHTLRIAFNVPGALSGAKQEESPLPDLSNENNALFIKEIIIKSNDAYLMTLSKNLRELMKRARTKEKYRREDDVTQQQALTLNRSGKRLVLRNLMVRHGGAHSRKIIGNLEAHINGLRYQAIRSENIDITYSNIRHAFFQPVTNEMIVLLHFHLKSPIMVQKKKVKDIQFYCETASQADDLDARRNRSNNDPDEIFEEQREYEKRRKLNQDFKRFVDEAQQIAPIEFEIPLRQLAFHGVPSNSSVILMPTQNCLVSLTDWPAFILPMDDVEVVSFERVLHQLKHFDAVFVPKDYGRTAQTITNIPVASLDMLKNWLNEMDIPWYEGKRNLAWPAILKTIRNDIAAFLDDDGFESFLGDGPLEKKKKESEEEGGGGSEVDEESSDDDEDEEYQETSSSGSDGEEDSDEGDEDAEEEGSAEGSEEGSDSEEDEDDDEDEEDEEDTPPRSRKRGSSGGAADAKRRRRN